ncbi:GNAT family N-acetyltransferase [Rhizobium sp. CG5]|uniref:GNAT family N-acetyltransferase n=1 Tax=Rhizobium sp. CG5 TaxID=2726076 RepID=UPI0020338821|nr:GNAT family N-acetyltransferase [Rhizobium sp. CG5]MCM2473985.1 GNAT family N-acetyltransferase [Rhizobium sp. CG5]
MIEIRRATPADADELLRLIGEHADYEKASATITGSSLAHLLAKENPPIILFVAAGGEGLAGYAALTFDHALWRASRYAHLDCLFVQAAARGDGIGKRLLDHVVREACATGADRLEWQTPQWNRDAIRFYERQGGVWEPKARFRLPLL